MFIETNLTAQHTKQSFLSLKIQYCTFTKTKKCKDAKIVFKSRISKK